MRDPGLPSLDQLRVFIAVIDHGGFAHAARALHRTQSVISYTIANLEEQLNIELLDRSKRKPVLTEAGKALLADARAVSLKVDGMRARAKALSSGLEAEVSLVVDVMFSTCKLVRILHAFQKEFPTVSMRLRTEALGAVTQLVMENTCKIGVSGWMPGTPDTIERQSCGSVTMVPVASPDHPLAQIKGKIPSAVLREHTQLVLTDRSTLTKGQDFGVMALRDWRLGDLSSKHALLRSGIGWGNMPVEFVQWDLDAGRLVQLDVSEGSSFSFPLYVIRRGDEEPGPATRWLMQQFLDLEHAGHGLDLAAHAVPHHAQEAPAHFYRLGSEMPSGPLPPIAETPPGIAAPAPIALRQR
ncbi:UNVERIFIED_ORG: DNA-binding transcriptional LysR family regulator [Zoogloea ramigera]|uniref:LysR family transcriptional regulator n=1 Tax=Duganella zoogloeoides TaxID=75659 RepID=A0ABZ0XUL3_9BURK|nr:LysR family transcriptional regulator [Duganella zoogloeoides]WQH03354.1 LysR family transcriptional regulator [Duganella zoogloeoides]